MVFQFFIYISSAIHYPDNMNYFCVHIRKIEYQIAVNREHSETSAIPWFSFISAEFLRYMIKFTDSIFQPL